MYPTELIHVLQESGVTLAVEGDDLRYRAPAGVLTPELRSVLTAQKQEVIDRLRALTAEQQLARSGRILERFHQEIHSAQSWLDLDGIQEAVQEAYERGELLQEQVEELAIAATEKARSLAEHLDKSEIAAQIKRIEEGTDGGGQNE